MQTLHRALLGLLALVLFCGANAQPAGQVAARSVGISPKNLMFIEGTYYYIEASAPKNWFNALSACQQIGYQLVSLQTEEKYKLVVSFLISSRQPTYFWTSGNDLFSLGSHHWYPGNETILDSLWAARQPDNAGGVEHCDALTKKSKSYSLRDYNCNLAKNYICEVPAPVATADPSTSTPSSTVESSTADPTSSSSADPTSSSAAESTSSSAAESTSSSAAESTSSSAAESTSSSTADPSASSTASSPSP